MSLLVLSRKRDEIIRIGDDIKIVVVEIRGDKCRLGIDAPKSTAVHRQEVFEAIERHRGHELRPLADSRKVELIREWLDFAPINILAGQQLREILDAFEDFKPAGAT